VIAGPRIQDGQRCQRVVSLLDLYPTLVEVCGLPANPKKEGHSLAPLLKEPSREWSYPAITGWQERSFAVQGERYRYIRYGDGSEELYDHQQDPHEWKNLATEPELKAVKSKLAEHVPPLRAK
jgi:arylsulfatase A-like enzyme